jgi:rRNA methylases
MKFARAVRDGREDGSMLIEGTRLFEEAIRSECHISTCFVTQSLLETQRGSKLLGLIDRDGTDVSLVSDTLLRTIADTANPQGIIAVARRPASGGREIEARLNRSVFKLVVFLVSINNPSNLGAVVRTAEAAGVAGVITSIGSADAFSPKSLRAAMGSAFRMPVWENANAQETIEWCDKIGLRTTSLDIKGTSNIYEADWREPRLLIIGSEAHGLDEDVLARSNDVLTIPMASPVESLNLAVSCGITIFEARRQSRK